MLRDQQTFPRMSHIAPKSRLKLVLIWFSHSAPSVSSKDIARYAAFPYKSQKKTIRRPLDLNWPKKQYN